MRLFNRVRDADKIYLISDCHFAHRNIVKGISQWENKDGCRDFQSTEQMDELILDNINSIVPTDATLINLGDIIFGDKSRLPDYLNYINCKEHHYIMGNHDHWMLNRDGEFKQEVSSLFSSMQFYLELFAKMPDGRKHRVCFQHFSQRVWHDSHKGSHMYYGHSHGSISNYGRSRDVGVDTNDFKPYRLSDLISWGEQQETIKVDHH